MHDHAAVVAFTVALLAGRSALAAAPAASAARVELRWHATPGCLAQAELAEMVEHTLDQPIFHGDRPVAAMLEGDVAPAADGRGGYHAHVVLRSPVGAVLSERDIGSPEDDCARLDDSLAVVVAMMVDGVHAAPTPLRVPTAPPARVARARVRSRAPVGVELEAGGAAALGLLPDASPGGYVRASLEVGRWSVGLAGFGWGGSDAIVLGSGAHVSAWTAELAGCGAVVRSRAATLRACVTFGAGFTNATPIALDGGADTRLPIVFEGLAVEGALRLAGPLWAHVRAAAWNPIVVPSYFFYGADGATHTLPGPWVVVPVLSLGLSVHFG